MASPSAWGHDDAMDTLPSVPASAGQLSWLREQVRDWSAAGLIEADQGTAILSRYHSSRRFSLGRLMLGLGAAFVGVGVIWLVAANLDQLTPLTRFLAVTALWLATLVGAELLAARGTSAVVVGAVRLLAAFGIGAVIFQAAQSLQVPAYEPRLVGLWGLAALVQAYAVRGSGPLLVGIAGVTTWSMGQGLAEPDPTFVRAVLVAVMMALVAVSVAALHERWQPAFVGPWRHVGAALVLVGLFVAGFPVSESWEVTWTWWPVLLVVLSVLAAGLAATLAPRAARWEVLGAVAVVAVSLVLAAWPAGGDPDDIALADVGHAVLGVVSYVAVAVGIAVVGTLRDSWLLTAMAALGLVVFTTFQSFAVFAPIIQGAWLFVVLGLVFLATGIGFDRVRRQLTSTLDDADPAGAPS